DWRAWVGPAISRSYFEVGSDVLEAFVDADAATRPFFVETGQGEKWLADLPALAKHRLCRAGVACVELSGQCTFGQSDRYYSYRRESNTGRMVTVAWLSNGTVR